MSEARGSPASTTQIERLQRRRLLLLAIAATAFLIWVSVDLWSNIMPGNRRGNDLVRSIAFLLWICTLAAMLAGRDGLMRQQTVRAALNDELTVAHRRTSLIVGYWLLVAAIAVIYVWSSFVAIAPRSVMALLLGLAVTAPTLCFVVLERRSEQDDSGNAA